MEGSVCGLISGIVDGEEKMLDADPELESTLYN